MNRHLQHIVDTLGESDSLPDEQKESVLKSLKAADKGLQILSFKLVRTKKVKQTTAILIEGTIEELEQKNLSASRRRVPKRGAGEGCLMRQRVIIRNQNAEINSDLANTRLSKGESEDEDGTGGVCYLRRSPQLMVRIKRPDG